MIDDASAASARLTRREMIRRLAGGAGAGMVCAGIGIDHPIQKHLLSGALAGADAQVTAGSWKPIFLDTHQDETLILVAERIVPNSSKAQVDRFIDLLLSVDSAENQKQFADSLAAIDQESLQRFGHPFKFISEAQQNALLTIFSAEAPGSREGERDVTGASSSQSGEAHRTLRDHFENLKGWISGVYYSSEVGMRELGWTGAYFFDNFPGCLHSRGHS